MSQIGEMNRDKKKMVNHDDSLKDLFTMNPNSLELRNEFKEFLKKEGDIDLWLFVEDVSDFKDTMSEDDRMKKGKSIYERYIYSLSDEQLSLSKSVVEKITNQIEHDPEFWMTIGAIMLFDEAVQELKNNQLEESWIRMHDNKSII